MSSASIILLTACFLLALQDSNGQIESECSWKLRLGRHPVDPSDAPDGINRYLISTNGKEGLRAVANKLKIISALCKEDVNSIRELTTLGNLITANMSRRALIWLCIQDLNAYISFVELDQQVSIFVPSPEMEI
jgi:hypothetical protein